MELKIPFNKPYLTGRELEYIGDAVNTGKISGNGKYTSLCHSFFSNTYGFRKCLLTTSCTDALEMAALLLNIKPGDEIIIPSYTFVSTANAFVLRGAKIIFADSSRENPNVDPDHIEELITDRSVAIVVVHYAGIACNMDKIMELASKYNLYVIEDAAQAIESYYIGKNGIKKPLGSIGQLATFSFHETKNIISGEGGMLVINESKFDKRAEIIWEKGTNRADFFKGEVDKYNWVDIGSSFLPSEIVAAFLYAQLEQVKKIQAKRLSIWNYYYSSLKYLENKDIIRLPVLPEFAVNNAHIFYIICKNLDHRENLIKHLKSKGILAVFHYQSLHQSPFFKNKHDSRNLPWSDIYSDTLIRLPLYFELKEQETNYIIDAINDYHKEM